MANRHSRRAGQRPIFVINRSDSVGRPVLNNIPPSARSLAGNAQQTRPIIVPSTRSSNQFVIRHPITMPNTDPRSSAAYRLAPKIVIERPNLVASKCIYLPYISNEFLDEYSKMEPSLRQTIQWGNIQAALKANFVNTKQVISWLDTVPIDHLSIESQQALIEIYRAVCLYGEEQDQYLDNQHFLSRHNYSAYQQIYLITHQDKNIDKDLISILSAEVMKVYQRKYHPLVEKYVPDSDIAVKLLEERKFDQFFSAHLNQSNYKIKLQYLLKCMIAAIKYEHIDWLLENLTKLIEHHKEELINEICDHSRHISEQAEQYWQKVTKPALANLLVKIKPDLAQKLTLKSLYSDLYPEFNGLSSLAIKVLNQRNDFVRAYLLAFPIQRYLPSEEEIIRAAQHLSKIGLANYCRLVYLHNKHWVKIRCINHGLPSDWFIPENTKENTESNPNSTAQFPVQIKINELTEDIISQDKCIDKPVNEDNLITEEIYKYSPFDLVYSQCDLKFHIFTRPEFNEIKKKKINPYDRSEMDPSVIQTINDRIRRAKLIGLPESTTLVELLQSVDADKLVCQPSNPDHRSRTKSSRPLISYHNQDPSNEHIADLLDAVFNSFQFPLTLINEQR